MPEDFPFLREDVFPSWFANRIQDFLSAAETNLRLSRKNATDVQVVPDTALGIAAVCLQGKWRFNEATVSRTHPGGAKATYTVWAVAEDNDIDETPKPHSDHTNYAFDLRITSGANPSGSGVEIFEKIGEIDWSGTEIEALRQTLNAIPGAMLADSALSSSAPSDITWTREAGGGLVAGFKANSVGAAEVAAEAIGESELGLLAVLTTKLAEEAVTTGKMANLAVTEAKLAAEGVATGKIKNLAVTAAKLAAEAVETGKIANLAVTAAKLAADAVEEAKIKDGAVSSRKIKPTVGLVVATEDLALTEAYADIVGAKLEITPLVASSLAVTAIFDFDLSVATTDAAVVASGLGSIKLDAAAEAANIARAKFSHAAWTGAKEFNFRHTVAETYLLTLSAAAHTIKLRAKREAGGTSTVRAAGTCFLYTLYAS